MSRHLAILLFFVLSLTAAEGCQKSIGDTCTLSTDCSVQGDRTCDISMPNGYCTVTPCDPGTCPDSADCVQFDANNARLARTYCMSGCSEDSDCRSGYHCALPDPATCVGDPNALVCNIITDPRPYNSPGWCVQTDP